MSAFQKRQREEKKRLEDEVKKQHPHLSQAVAPVDETSGTGAEEELSQTAADLPVKVREVATGKIVTGEDAPKASQIDAWLETHPG